MATVTSTIGTGVGRDYSTITLWEADLDDGTIYASGDDAVGECYNDSTFDEAVTVNGGNTIGLTSRTLTVASGERHDGTAGSGARMVWTTGGSGKISVSGSTTTTISWLEIDCNAQNITNGAIYSSHLGDNTWNNLIIHDTASSGAKAGIVQNGGNSGSVNSLLNNIIYDIVSTATGSSLYGLSVAISSTTGKTIYIFNNTVHNTAFTNGGPQNPEGIHVGGVGSEYNVKNNIVTDTSTTGSGTPVDFDATISTTNALTNLSSDATAPGTGSLTSKTSANQFVSTVGGSEDLHLKAGADAIDAGTDLGTTPSGVEIDIDGRDRDAEGDTWDIGADEFVTLASVTAAIHHYKMAGGL